MKKNYFLLLVVMLATTNNSFSQVRLPQMVRDSMVLQRDARVNIWGWASPKEKVKIRFQKKEYKTAAGSDGKWKIILQSLPAGGPYIMEIEGRNKIVLKNILIGDVWFCSGQSNMVHQLNIHDVTYADEIANADYPQIRQFWIPTLTSLQGPQPDLPTGYWAAAVGEAVRPFSAVAYFFAKKLYEKYKVPIGIINASVGGTPIEAWMSEDGFKDFSAIQSTITKNKDTAYINGLSRRPASGSGNRQPPAIQDKGIIEKWYSTSYNPKGWKAIAIPGYWEDQGIKELNGVVWYRREIILPENLNGKAAKLFLGRIVDADVAYINGTLVGTTTYMYPQRRYSIPAGLLKTGKNTIVVKVTNNNGKGGFVPDKPYYLFTSKDTVDLTGYWQYKVGEVFVPRSFGGGFGGGISAQNQPAALYNAMVAPEINYTIKGFVWYQGESNSSRAGDYAKLQPAQISDWRNQWQQGNLPFIYIQLPGFMDYNYLPAESQWADFREAQLKSLSVPNSAMAVAIDLGEWNDIHPDNKKTVGERVALAAQKIAYGEDVIYSGPIYKSSEIDDGKIEISFSHVGGGLITNDDEAPAEFAIAGADKKFVWAKAKIEGDKVVVWSDEVKEPKFVRYAWADNPVNPNVYNKEGLPASPFRTDL